MLDSVPPSADSGLEPPSFQWWNWLHSAVFLTLFCGILLIFDPLLRCVHRFKLPWYDGVVEKLNQALLLAARVNGVKYAVPPLPALRADRPVIVVSNHQSLLDICLLTVAFAKQRPGFVSKTELAHWLPFVSYNLRNGRNVLIDREDGAGAVKTLVLAARRLAENKTALVIFPEGTRSRSGKLLPFRTAGLLALLRRLPEASLVPVAIDGSWRFAYRKLFPVPWGVQIKVSIRPVIELNGDDDAVELTQRALDEIRVGMEDLRRPT